MHQSNNLEVFFSTHFPFNTEGLKELLDSFEVKLITKGEIILQANRIEEELKFINKGYIREYYSKDSKEVNINFYGAMEFSTDISSFYNSTPTMKSQECLTDVEIQCMSKEVFDTLLNKYNCGNTIISKSMQSLIKAKDRIEYNRITKNTEELYKNIVLRKPEWIQNIPQYHIASYLNITPETLSRIRKRLS